MLRQGRNDFKNAIRRYNDSAKSNQGESLFMSEKLELDDIFKLTIIDAIDDEDKKIIQSIYPLITKNSSNMVNNISELETEQIISEPTQSVEAENSSFLFGDNWYKSHPDKILGIAYETTGRWGKVTKYSGDIQVLSRIEVDENFIGANKALNDPLASVSHDMNISAEILKPDRV